MAGDEGRELTSCRPPGASWAPSGSPSWSACPGLPATSPCPATPATQGGRGQHLAAPSCYPIEINITTTNVINARIQGRRSPVGIPFGMSRHLIVHHRPVRPLGGAQDAEGPCPTIHSPAACHRRHITRTTTPPRAPLHPPSAPPTPEDAPPPAPSPAVMQGGAGNVPRLCGRYTGAQRGRVGQGAPLPRRRRGQDGGRRRAAPRHRRMRAHAATFFCRGSLG